MKREDISELIGNINEKHIVEAENYSVPSKKTISIKKILFKTPAVACVAFCLLVGAVAYTTYEISKYPEVDLYENGTNVSTTDNSTNSVAIGATSSKSSISSERASSVVETQGNTSKTNETNSKKATSGKKDTSSKNAKDDRIAFEGETSGDYSKLAFTFKELVKDSDLIFKIKVKSTKSYIDKWGSIKTDVTPIVEEVYKGTYNNENLNLESGEVLYDEYSQNEVIKYQLSGHEDPNDDDDEKYKGKYVRESLDGLYIMSEGEEYIIFARRRSKNEFYPIYGYQGAFKIIDGKVGNKALYKGEDLGDNICKIFNIKPKESKTEERFLVPENEFVEKLKSFL